MWIYEGKEIDDNDIVGYASFVYIITNLETNKRYIGKKIFKSIRRQKVKGKTRKKKVEKESDWKNYFGSNLALHKDLAELGPDKFRREIVKLCKTRGTASYWEAKLQMQYEVLEHPELFYNEWVMCKVHRSHLKLDNK